MIDGANVGDSRTITYSNYVNLLEEYAPNNVASARTYSFVIWSDGSFTFQNPQQIEELTIVSGGLTNHNLPRLTNNYKAKVQDRMHNKFMAHQIMSILDKSVVCAIQLRKKDHTWRSTDGRDIEVSGLTL